MKKALVIAALVGFVAAPAMAGLTPHQMPSSAVSMVDLGSKSDPTPRATPSPFGYKPNSPLSPYDNNWGDPFGPLVGGPAAYGSAASPYIGGSTFVFDDVVMTGSATITNINWTFYNPGACGTSGHIITIAFFSQPGPYTIGATLAGYSATFNCGFFYAGLDISTLPAVLPQNFWIAFKHNTGGLTQVFGSAGLPVNGAPHTSPSVPSTVLFRGSGGAPMVFFNTLYGSAALGSGQLMVWLTTPEPTTIGLLVLGGLLVLRRRKA